MKARARHRPAAEEEAPPPKTPQRCRLCGQAAADLATLSAGDLGTHAFCRKCVIKLLGGAERSRGPKHVPRASKDNPPQER